jgi:alpha-ketoglutarate-dependent taurine dioxygenase
MTQDIGQTASFGIEAWRGADLEPDRGCIALPSAVIDELDACVASLQRAPLPVESLSPREFALDATRGFAAGVRGELERGCGFALLDRLPTGEWGRAGSIAAFWLLASCIGRPVAQSHDGKLVYDVTDRGRPPGNGVRPDVTNVAQNFHTDNSYNHVPPQHVALLCLQPARSGGASGIVNFAWALEQMRQRHAALLPRLYQPFYFDRQREHAEGDVLVTHHPLFQREGARLVARLSYRQVVNGQRLAGKPLDREGKAALEALEAILEEPGAARTFQFEPGQVQLVNNRALGHRRSAFQDHPEPARRRHLVRLWLRDGGGRGYHG